jgi:drug/metabolite transporter (DMT)-like permease
MTIAVVFAVAAAFFNAVNIMAQHAASLGAQDRHSGWRIAVYLARDPLWLIGLVAAAVGFLFYSVALHYGPLAVVQPLLVTELVSALILRRLWIRQRVSLLAWGAALAVSVALAVFLIAAAPHGGTATATPRQWIIVVAVFGAVVGGLAVLARAGSPTRKAALLAVAAALAWALTAVFIKVTTDALASYGVVGMMLHWQVYAFIVCAAAAIVLQQSALHVGPLSVSQPLVVVVDPIASIILSAWLFNERLTGDPIQLAVAIAAFAVVAGGVVVLSMTTPVHLDGKRPVRL